MQRSVLSQLLFLSTLVRRRIAAISRLAACTAAGLFCIYGCTSIQMYRPLRPVAELSAECSEALGGGAGDCDRQSTERHANYTMHVVEFDDEGWPFDEPRPGGAVDLPASQLDSAMSQIRGELADPAHCVQLFIYVHGWQHNADGKDSDVDNFRNFLDAVAKRRASATDKASSACTAPIQAKDPKSPSSSPLGGAPGKAIAAGASASPRIIGVFVGWRGLSLEGTPLKYASFWDRKNTAERVAQGSVREMFGRLSTIADANRYAPNQGSADGAAAAKLPSRLSIYVIGHSFGASVVFRAISQTLVDSFSGSLDDAASSGAPSIARFVDMVVLVNPAIEAARFDPVFRAAAKRAARCGAAPVCFQPPYQAPVLAIFTSEGDWATGIAYPVGATLGNIFEKTTSPEQTRAIHKTIGWDDDYVTHVLKPGSCTSDADRDPFEGSAGNLRYRAPGWTWCFADERTGTLSLTQVPFMPGKTSAAPTYNGPLWNVRVSSRIIANHDDIWNEKFRGVLLHFFADARSFPIDLQRSVDGSATSSPN